MTDATFDRPDNIVFPPLIPLATLVVACTLQWIAPLGWTAILEAPVRIGIGMLVAVSGLAITVAGQRALKKHGTNVSPSQPTTMLVIDGVFARTRNPLYLGGTVALCGVALIFALDWMLLLILPSCVVLHFAVVTRGDLSGAQIWRRISLLPGQCSALFRPQLMLGFSKHVVGNATYRKAASLIDCIGRIAGLMAASGPSPTLGGLGGGRLLTRSGRQ